MTIEFRQAQNQAHRRDSQNFRPFNGCTALRWGYGAYNTSRHSVHLPSGLTVAGL